MEMFAFWGLVIWLKKNDLQITRDDMLTEDQLRSGNPFFELRKYYKIEKSESGGVSIGEN